VELESLIPPLERKAGFSQFEANVVQYSSPVLAALGLRGLLAWADSKGHFFGHEGFPFKPGPANYDPLLWTGSLGYPIYSTPAYIDLGSGDSRHRLYLAGTDGLLHSINAETGAKLWAKGLGAAALASPLAATVDGIPAVFAASNSGWLTALRAADGTPLWMPPSIKELDGFIYASPLYEAAQNLVVVPTYKGTLYAMSASTGSLVWTRIVGPTRATPAVVEGIVWNLSVSGELSATRMVDGGAAFPSFAANRRASSSPAAYRNGAATEVLMAFEDGTVALRRYADGAGDGTTVWDQALSGETGIHASPTIANGVAYLGTKDGRLVALDLQNGATLQEIQVASQASVLGNPVIAENTLFFTSDNGEVAVYGMPVAQIVVEGPSQPSTDSSTSYSFKALDLNGNLVPTFAQDLKLEFQFGAAANVTPTPLRFEKGKAQATLTFPQAGGLRMNVQTSDGANVVQWASVDLLVQGGAPIPTPDPEYTYYNYMVVRNMSPDRAMLDSTVQLSDGSGFFDTAARINALPAKLRPDGADMRVYNELGQLVNHHLVTNPQNVNTVIRFKVPYLAAGEQKVYLLAFGKPDGTFPSGYEKTAYMRTVYGRADSFDGGMVEPITFDVATGTFNPAVGRLTVNPPSNLEGRPLGLDSSYGVRYEFKVGGGLLDQVQHFIRWSLADLAGSGQMFRMTIGYSPDQYAMNFQMLGPGTSGSFGTAIVDSPAVKKHYIAKLAPGTFLAGRDLKDPLTDGVDFGVGIGVGNSPAVLSGESFPIVQQEGQNSAMELDWITGWSIHSDHPTAILLDPNVAPPAWWTYGPVSNDPVTETVWVGFYGESGLTLQLPDQSSQIAENSGVVDLAISGDHVLVLDAQVPSIRVYDPLQLSQLAVIPLQLSKPAALAVDPLQGWYWVADSEGAKIVAVDLSGTVQAELTQIDGLLVEPTGIAFASDGRMFVADRGRHRVFALAPDGSLLWGAGSQGYEIGRFEALARLAFDNKRELLYVADPGNKRVAVYGSDGIGLRQFPRSSQAGVSADDLSGLSLQEDGSITVVDRGLGRLLVANANGDLVGYSTSEQLGLLSPTAAVISVDGTWWVADAGHGRLLRLGAQGSAGGSAQGARLGGGKDSKPRRKFLPANRDVMVAPNPSKAAVKIGFWLESQGRARLTLVNLVGEVVWKQEVGEMTEGEVWVTGDFSRFASGVYFMVLQSDLGEGWRARQTFKVAIVK
jgi:outer membrane protein assembly factor BamB